MPRNMSFFMTQGAVRRREKTVTRRLGWWFLKAGDIVNAVVKAQGLKRGEKVEKICRIRIISAWAEPLNIISDEEVAREGFPDWTRWDFIKMFRKHFNCPPHVVVNRIEFEYMGEDEMDEKKVNEFFGRVKGSIRTLDERAGALESLTPETAESLLMYAECIVSCLQGFVFCSEHDARIAAERGAA